MKAFEVLDVYKLAFSFTVDIFKLTEHKKLNRNLANQLERAALSISNNIAEGFELQSNRQFIKFLFISKGSCGESRNILAIADALGQISKSQHLELKERAIAISKQLSNFIKYLKTSGIE